MFHAKVNRDIHTPTVSGVSDGGGKLWTPAASISFGFCAWSSGSDCVKCIACKDNNSDRVLMMNEKGAEKVICTIVYTEGFPGQTLGWGSAEKVTDIKEKVIYHDQMYNTQILMMQSL